MKRTLLLLFMGLMCLSTYVLAQQKTITGTVTSAADDAPLEGVSVRVKGTAMETLTDENGNFTISGNEGQTLTFSFIGMAPAEVVIGTQSSITVMLDTEATSLEEVAVTAFGIRQQTRSLGFATQNVKAQEITDSRQSNVVNALQGKVAGVQITNSGGSPGASSSIYLRGGTSLSGNNQPLFVVDGIPIDNTTPIAQGGLNPADAPATNRGFDINPEDIESMTVLKGPAAAALYGIRAASGAIVITTKKGSGGAARVQYGNLFSLDQVSQTPTLQSVYKQGENGVFTPQTQLSWGPTFDAGETVYDNFGDFFTTGFSHNHDLTVSGSSERSSIYASASIFNQDGIVKNTDFGKKSFRLTAETKVGDKLSIGGTANYVNTDRTYFSQGGGDGVMGAITWPRNDNMEDYLNPDGSQRELDPSGTDNPYWTINKKPINNDVHRIIAAGNVSYDPLEWLNLTYRLGTDYYTEKFQSIFMPGTLVENRRDGYITEATTGNQLTTSTFLATAKKSFDEKFNLSLTVGHNLESSYRETVNANAVGFIDPDFPSINNTNPINRQTSKRIDRRRIVGVFGDLNLDYRGMVFLNFRARNDWTSTLIKDNSFFYPSISTSIIVTDLLEDFGVALNPDVVSFGKIRAAWAQVGKDALPHVTATRLGTYINDFTINPRGFITLVNEHYGNPDLVPEFTNSYEIGADVRFWRNRLGLDVTWYLTRSDNQILGTRVPPSAGAFLAYLNGGEIQNKGVEAILNIEAIRKQDFSWNADINFSANRATVRDLPGDLDRVELSDSWAGLAQGAAFLDGSLFGINGPTWRRNEAGELLLDNNGRPQGNTVLTQIGDRNPDWIAGITNTFRYKQFGLSFMWDFRVGGDIYNSTANALVASGLSMKTLDRGSMVFDGIIESTGERNTQAVELNQNFYQTVYATNGPEFVEDGSWARLRYVTLTYDLPSALLNRWGVRNLQLTASGRNLLLFTSYSGVDPEVSGSGAGVGGTGSFGFDNLGVPATKSVDLGLKFSF
ncbi:SusC/RagA family TonB-linked outer membrane protein [Parapedobacter tibetensis]|uniref:SusC/RagA family TonB-linked outer membrane protein n=1 Tax=Parapedobacter tibetensis TaxID=2972951 RepID=UPI00214D5A24|nr:SusC/RagA family TonB-linked outer membrane protein [Parapedobacter tibetensis]